MKLSAVAQCGLRKDFYGVHALLTRHCPLSELLALYREKFQISDITPVLYGLSYFDDAEQEPEPLMLEKTTWKQVKQDIVQWLNQATRSL